MTAALAGFALLWLDRRPLAAGILIGLLAIKPHLALLFPLALVAEGRWRSIAAAAATVLALVAASLAAFGWAEWAAFLHHLPLTMAMGEEGAVPWATMPSPYVFALSLGTPAALASALQGAVALFAAGCVWRVWRQRGAAFEVKAATLDCRLAPRLALSVLLRSDLGGAGGRLVGDAGACDGFHRGEREILLFAWLAPAVMQPVHC